MNQSTIKSVMRLFALTKQFCSNENKDNEVKAIVENYVYEYTGVAEAEDYITIFNYHNLQFNKREKSTKTQSLYSVKSTIIITEVANDLSRVNRIHLALVILDILTVGGSLSDSSMDFFRTICTTFKFSAEEQADSGCWSICEAESLTAPVAWRIPRLSLVSVRLLFAVG